MCYILNDHVNVPIIWVNIYAYNIFYNECFLNFNTNIILCFVKIPFQLIVKHFIIVFVCVSIK